MFIIKSAFCRGFQMVFRMALPFLPYREPEIISSCPKLGRVLIKEDIKSVMIVTDKGILNNGLTTPIEDILKKSGVSYIMYDKTQPNPTVHNVEEVLALYQQNHCDSLIAIGGGSSIDCAKAVGARLAHPRKSLNQLKGILRVWRKLPILIAVPTTAGTGSEVTLASIITDSEKHHKYALMSFPLIPHYAVLDANMTVSLPTHLTSTTGMDALTHAVEAYIGRSTTSFDSFDKLIEDLKQKEKPLALYLFSSDKTHMNRVTRELSYGGGCINDVVINLATSEMGFGGFGESGMGSVF